jgi:hypothetical protein
VNKRIRAAAIGLLLGMLWNPGDSQALDVVAVYRTACQRQIGVILRVEKRRIHLLHQDGTIGVIPRHEIVSLVHYPVAQFPIAPARTPITVLPIRIETRQNREWVELAHGWPINYSERKLSLLLPSGKDFSVDRNSVWKLRFATFPAGPQAATWPPPPRPLASSTTSHPASQPASQGATSPSTSPRDPSLVQRFEHPQTSGFCVRSSAPVVSRGIYPQQILNDRVVIKRELDRLMSGYEELLEDMEDQKFYPVPLIYRNRTSLGFWGSFLSRHAASHSRSNNLTPLLTNTYSSGPFRYQHIIFTGNTPNRLLIHNESQTQVFYSFKAAYFHTSLLVDPNLALVGKKFFWRSEDLDDEQLDDRVSEYAIVELGFDLGPVALQLQPVSMAHVSVKADSIFDTHRAVDLWRGGLLLTLPEWSVEAMGGYATAESRYSSGGDDFGNEAWGTGRWAYAYARLNLQWHTPWRQISLRVWTVVRHLRYELERSRPEPTSSHRYRSVTVSNALQVVVPFLHRFEAGGHVIIETQSRSYQDQPWQLRVLPKLSLFAGMSF